MQPRVARIGLWLILSGLTGPALWPGTAGAFESRTLDSVVSVLPLWPGHTPGGQPQLPPGAAPEGTAVAIRRGGYLVTAFHVVDRALEIAIRLRDGRAVPARLVGRDPPTDLAVLKIETDLPVLEDAPEPALAAPVCAIGNSFGLDLSVTCGVVSAVHRSGVGFNSIEDFVQTDASVNPGASGGALVDDAGRLVGILSAIFTKGTDADIGVNFAASIALVRRVVDDLIDHGRVRRRDSGLRVADLEPREAAELAGARVITVAPDGAAARAGLAPGDVITAIGAHRVRKSSDVTGLLQLHRPGATVTLTITRQGTRQGSIRRIDLILPW